MTSPELILAIIHELVPDIRGIDYHNVTLHPLRDAVILRMQHKSVVTRIEMDRQKFHKWREFGSLCVEINDALCAMKAKSKWINYPQTEL